MSGLLPIAICDGGSNAVRLVVYKALARVPEVLVAEKTFCQLGRTLSQTGALDPEGRALALDALTRYVKQARKLKADPIELLCTEAVRRARDGRAFLSDVQTATGLKPVVISGMREARLAAYGILAGMNRVDGVAGDLGGGSLELMRLDSGRYRTGVSLPLGTLRRVSPRDRKAMFDRAPWLADLKGRTFIATGGSWRTLAKLYMHETGYPLDIVDGLAVEAPVFATYSSGLAKATPASLQKRAGYLKKNLDVLPPAAQLLGHILKTWRPAEIVFSAGGVREGALYARLPAATRRQDPLIAVARRLAGSRANNLVLEGDRLLVAGLLLSRVGWDGAAAVEGALHLPVPGLPHGERVFLALVMAAYHGVIITKSLKACLPWLEDEDIETAEAFGRALAEDKA